MNRIVFIVVRVIAAALLVWALAKHPIGYYTILRLVTCGVCAYGAYLALQLKQTGWAFIFGAIALLFQPIFTFRMTRQTWQYVDIATAVILLLSILFFRTRSKE